MKKNDLMKKLSDMTKIPADKLQEIITSDAEDVDVELAELHIYTDDELESFKKNMTSEASKTAIEMAVKEQRNLLKEAYGTEFDFQGKTMTNLIDAALKAGEKKAGVKPNEQLLEKEKIISQLKENLLQLESEKVQVLNDKNQIVLDYEINSTITKAIPSDIESIWAPEEIADLWKKNHQIVIEDGKKMVKKNGEILRDKKTQDPLPVDSVVATWLLEKGVTKKQAQGRGDGDKKQKQGDSQQFKNVGEIVDYALENNLPNEKQVELTRQFYKDNPNYGN
jgi:hypothetical protein